MGNLQEQAVAKEQAAAKAQCYREWDERGREVTKKIIQEMFATRAAWG